MLRRILLSFIPGLLLLLVSVGVAVAQYGPPGPIGQQSTVGFWTIGKTTAISASTSSASHVLSATANQVQVYNATTAPAFVIFGSTCTGLTASAGSGGTNTSDYPVGPGAIIVVTVPSASACAAVILGSSSGLVYFTPGVGL